MTTPLRAFRSRSRAMFPVPSLSVGVCAFLLIFAGGWVPAASAGRLPRARPTPAYKAPYDVIDSVSAKDKTVTIGHRDSRDHTTMILRVTKMTEIQVSGQKGDFSKLRKGMRVDVTRGTDETEASRLVAN